MIGYSASAGAATCGYGSQPPDDWAGVWQVVSSPGTHCGSLGGVGGRALVERVVKLLHLRIRSRSSGIFILLRGSFSKMRLRMKSSSGDNGSIELKNLGLFRYARKVESSMDARFHGLRPQVRFTRMIPRLHTSLGPEA